MPHLTRRQAVAGLASLGGAAALGMPAPIAGALLSQGASRIKQWIRRRPYSTDRS
jgi:hypothetical protein